MINLNLEEVKLMRILTSLFGVERVVPQMSVLSICGGALPELYSQNPKIHNFSKRGKCLFTVVDNQDQPKLVVELHSGFKEAVDPVEAEHLSILPELFTACGIKYVSIDCEELDLICDRSSGLDIISLLNQKI
jgi:hypothetical protein